MKTDSLGVRALEDPFYGCNLLVPIKFTGMDKSLVAVVDTAAQISMVRSGLLDSIHPCAQEVTIHTAAEDSTMKCSLLQNVEFKLENQQYTHSFASGPISDDCILGLDFLLSQDANIDLPSRTILLGRSPVSATIQYRSSETSFGLCRVCVACSVRIPAKTCQLVEIKFDGCCKSPVVTEPRSTDKILVGSFLLSGGSGGVIEVINDSSSDITLKKDHHLTNATELDEIVCQSPEMMAERSSNAPNLPKMAERSSGVPSPDGAERSLHSASSGQTSTDGGFRVRQAKADELPDWREVDEINNAASPLFSTFVPPTSITDSDLHKLHITASEEVPEHLRSMYNNACPKLCLREQVALARLLTVYGDVFSRDKTDLGLFTLLTHRIRTYNEEPVKERLRRTPLKFQKEEEKTINDMLTSGVIEPSFSEWASAPVLVRKKDGEVRYTVDFRQVNIKTLKDAYPLPLIDECTDTLAGNLWFHTLDLASGYWQIAVHPDDRHKTAFLTRYGLFQHVRMAQGLCNAPATFQRVIHLVLRGLTWNKALVYLDDIIVLGKSFTDSLQNLELVLQRMRAHNLKLKPKKCQLFQTEVQFLGRTVSREGVAVTEDHVECLRRWPAPKNQNEVEKLLGFVNYHRDFLPGLAGLLTPLYALTKPGAEFKWTEECEKIFCQLKERLSTTPLLAYPNNEDPYILDTDASDLSVGAALYQVQEGKERPISFASFSLTPAQQKYCTTRKELLAIVVFTRRFRHYLLGRHFTIRTDHGSLTWLCKFKNLCGQLGRWLEELSQYDMAIVHRPGAKHINADSLSRIPPSVPICSHYSPNSDLHSLPCGGCSYCTKLHHQWARFEEEVDFVSPLLTRLISLDGPRCELIPTGRREDAPAQTPMIPQSNMTAHASLGRANAQCPLDHDSTPFSPGMAVRRILGVGDQGEPDTNDKLDRTSNYLSSYTREELRNLQLEDPELRPIMEWLETTEPSTEELFRYSFVTKWLWRHRDQLQIKDGVLYYSWVGVMGESPRHVVPLSAREETIRLAHDTQIGGHWGKDKTVARVSQSCYWPSMERDIGLYVATCVTCNQQKNRRKQRADLQDYQAGYPGERVHLDFLGPFSTSRNGNKYILSIIDQFTKWIEVCPLPDQTAELTAKTLVDRWISRFGMPVIIHTDQGKNFDSVLFGQLCEHLEIQKTRTTAYRPASNGQVERYNQQIASFIRCFLEGKSDTWDEHLDVLGMSLRATVSRATGFTPNFMMLGREVLLPMDILLGSFPKLESAPEFVRRVVNNMTGAFNLAREKMKATQIRGKQDYSQRAPIRSQKFQRGDLVMLVNSSTRIGKCKKLQPVWLGPYIIVDVVSPVLYKVAIRNRTSVQHVDRMRLYVDRVVPMWVQRRRNQLFDDSVQDTEYDDDMSGAMHQLFNNNDDTGESSLTDATKPTVVSAGSLQAGIDSHSVPSSISPNPDSSVDEDRTDDDIDLHATDDGTSNPNPVEPPDPVASGVRTRTGRQTRLPARFRDYTVEFN